MRVLFDNGTPRSVAQAPHAHIVEEARSRGWDTLRNGELLDAAEAAGFDAFLTASFPASTVAFAIIAARRALLRTMIPGALALLRAAIFFKMGTRQGWQVRGEGRRYIPTCDRA